ncbi:SusC/RagA family TonB-linked outer membrane protein [Chryseobacterium sp. YR221]|uniref:SusC/RagA family TonB-linked outer membrane protein n=1 Tax=Chryseobacterium sp. YR221 TaxID=1500293 RepID=UPI0009D8C1A2|nr:SusC/RagA family TonB-linked outer membrane protein [Chryseobacterium sp. YR221]SMC45758.1 TonB-linked outer membrane protein, SusC/RagA family [Chryseobacterium sp. YR221]
MNVKLHVLSAGALFFLGQVSFAQKAKDTATTKIDEVVVVAFGKQKREALVGSVSVIDKKVLETQQLTSVTSAIQGSVPGVQLISAGGQPGENPLIKIRGTASINASTNPLIILDGVPYNGNINSISQDQVESINVLKDASSTSLYGSRGANGVILINTKKGRRNQAPRLEFSAQTGFSSPAVNMYKFVDAGKYMGLYWEALRNSRVIAGDTPAVAANYATNNLVANLGYNPYGNITNPIGVDGKVVPGANLLWNTDWEKEILNRSSIRNDYRLTLQGGGENTTYFFSADYLDQEGSVVSSYFKRFTTRLNLETQVKSWLKAGVNTSMAVSSQNYPTQSGNSFTSAIQWIYNVASIYPIYRRDESGNMILDNNGSPIYDYGANGNGQNQNRPVFNNENVPGVFFNNKINNKRYDINLSGYLEAEIFKGLKNKLQVGYQLYIFDGYQYNNSLYGAASNVSGRVSTNRDITQTINVSNILNYQKSFGDHNFNVDGIFESYQLQYSPIGTQSTGFLPGVFYHSGSTKPESVSGNLSEDRIVSVLGRLAYNYKNKYFVEGSFRSDGSSRFSKDTRWGNFYSIGGSWVASKESFFENNVVTYLKFRGSYGELGNNGTLNIDNVANAEGIVSSEYFPYINGYTTGYSNLDQAGIYLTNTRYPRLTWETTSSLNVGADFELFKRVNVTVDYYKKASIDLLYPKPLAPSSGFSQILLNTGKIENYGWEFSINSTNIKKENLTWTTNLNFSFDKNKIKELEGGNFVNGTKRWEVGKSLFDFWIQEYAGIDPKDGYMMWYKDVKDANGNIIGRETTKTYADATRYFNGKSALPDIQGGFSNYIKFKEFDLNFLFNFSFGSYILDSQYANLLVADSPGRQISADIDGRWQTPGDITDIPVLTSAQNDFSSTSSRWLFKNDYIRLKAITLGYNIPRKYVEQLGISDFRLYVQADNLWTWQSHKGIDPEQSFGGTVNNRSYNLKTISFGFKLGF